MAEEVTPAQKDKATNTCRKSATLLYRAVVALGIPCMEPFVGEAKNFCFAQKHKAEFCVPAAVPCLNSEAPFAKKDQIRVDALLAV